MLFIELIFEELLKRNSYLILFVMFFHSHSLLGWIGQVGR